MSEQKIDTEKTEESPSNSPTGSYLKIVKGEEESCFSGESKRTRSSGTTRTTYNYVNMIVECILRSPKRRVLLNEIYKYVQNNYKEMIDKGVDWQNGIRHNLSLNDCFMKDGRNPNGKGYFWTIAPKNLTHFERGDFRRRWSQCRTRRQRDNTESRRQASYMMSPNNLTIYPSSNSFQNVTPISTSSISPSGSSYYDRRPRLCLATETQTYSGNFQTGNISPNNAFYNVPPQPFYPPPYFTNYHEQTQNGAHSAYYPTYPGFVDPCVHSQHVTTLHTPSPYQMTQQVQGNIEEAISPEISERQFDKSRQEGNKQFQDHSMSTIIYRH